MTAAWKSIVITAILAALASGAATWASATWVMRERQPPSLHSRYPDRTRQCKKILYNSWEM